jgi:hypothetical protein
MARESEAIWRLPRVVGLAGAALLFTVCSSWVLIYVPIAVNAPRQQPAVSQWLAEIPANWPDPEELAIVEAFGRRVTYQSVKHVPEESSSGMPRLDGLVVYETGFPFRCLRGSFYYSFDVDRGPAFKEGLWRSGINVGGRRATPALRARQFLPVQPKLISFVCNWFAWTACGALPFETWRRWRRHARRSRGECVRCGFSIAGVKGGCCPECGLPL